MGGARLAGAAKKDPAWADAIQTVLNGADGALHYTEIAKRISSQGVRQNVGANPAATVAAILSKSLGDAESPFQKLGRGEYILKVRLSPEAPVAEADDASAEPSETGALRAFGMFWQRDQVIWAGKGKLFGVQQHGASAVNFAEQLGVYLLHDRERVIYVGRASDTLFVRLKAHTVDRLGGRWDRFSWFGLRAVGDEGKLEDASVPWSHNVVIDTLEALLIESLEPPLNRKRGDNFSGVEYLQVTDPEIEKQRNKALVERLLSKMESRSE